MKMKVVWTGEAREPKEWVFDRDNPSWDIAYATETETGWPWPKFIQRIDDISFIAWRALLWSLRKRDEQRLRVDAVEFVWAETDMYFQCPRCEEWESMTVEVHECAFTEPESDDPEPDAAPEPEPAKGKKKAGSDPEA